MPATAGERWSMDVTSSFSMMFAQCVTPTVVQGATPAEVAEALFVTIDGDAVGDVGQHVPHD
jgi:hypothetical protein